MRFCKAHVPGKQNTATKMHTCEVDCQQAFVYSYVILRLFHLVRFMSACHRSASVDPAYGVVPTSLNDTGITKLGNDFVNFAPFYHLLLIFIA